MAKKKKKEMQYNFSGNLTPINFYSTCKSKIRLTKFTATSQKWTQFFCFAPHSKNLILKNIV